MHKWLTPPHRADEYETFAAYILHYTLLLLFVLTAVSTLFTTTAIQRAFVPEIFFGIGVCYWLLHTRRLRVASIVFVCSIWVMLTVMAVSINGIRNAGIADYALVIIFSAILLSNRAVIVSMVVSILAVVALALGELQGVLPLQTTPLYLADRFFQSMALFGAAGVLLSASARVIRTNYERIRKHEQSLLERNRELETEIGERERVEAALRTSEAKYRQLFESVPIMAGVYAQDGEIILLNRAGAATLGGTPETLQGHNLREAFTPDDAERALWAHNKVIEEQKERLTNDRTVLRSGRELHYLRHIMPLPKNGNTPQVLVLTTDLTEKYEAEQRERELALSREKNTILLDFFSTLSHDLKTPLSVINTNLYLLRNGKSGDKREEQLDRISKQVILLDNYIRDMLVTTQLEYIPKLDPRAFDLNVLIQSSAELFRPRMESKQITYEFSAQPGLPMLTGEVDQITRALTNLIENAVNYTRAGGKVTVRTLLTEEYVTLEIADTGIGIEAEAVPRIFERFYRSPNAQAFDQKGTGLGLAIVRKILDLHHATIEIQSKVGEGTTFRIQFPRNLSQAADAG